MNKKGALELSVNTIVIIVIGITLLTLGLVFVRDIFGRLGGLSSSAFEGAETTLSQIEGAETKLNFPQQLEVERGESVAKTVKICNVDGTGTDLKLRVRTGTAYPSGGKLKVEFPSEAAMTVLGSPSQETISPQKNLGNLMCVEFPVVLSAASDATPASAQLVLMAEQAGGTYSSQAVVIKIVK